MKPVIIIAALVAAAVPACQTTDTTDDHSGHGRKRGQSEGLNKSG